MILPVGISFYTFQAMAYTIDVYRGSAPACRDFPSFALYVSYFPHLVAGSIQRTDDLLAQLLRPRKVTWDQINSGLLLAVIGLLRKMAVADVYERSIMVSPICRELSGEWRPQNCLSLIRARYWVRARLQDRNEVTASGFEPLDRVKPDTDGVFDKFAVRRDPQGLPLPSRARVALLEDLAHRARTRGFRLVFVIPPAASTLGDDLQRVFKDELTGIAARYPSSIIDLRHDLLLGRDCFADNFHLNRKGAGIYSQQLASLLTPWLPGR